MEEPKKLIYDSGEQPEEVFLRVSGYLDRDRLYVGIYQIEYGYPELFSDLTVNLHHAPLKPISTTISAKSICVLFGNTSWAGYFRRPQFPVTAPFRRSPLT